MSRCENSILSFSFVRRFVLTFVAFFGVIFCVNAQFFPHAASIKNYNKEDFIINTDVFKIIEDFNGCMIASATNGLKYYTGTQWFDIDSSARYKIHDLFVDKHHNIFYAGGDNIGYYSSDFNGRFINHPLDFYQKNNLYNSGFFTTFLFKDSVVVFGGKNNFMVYNYKIIKKIDCVKLNYIYNCGNFILLFGQNGILYKTDCKKIETLFDFKTINFKVENINVVNLHNTELLITNVDNEVLSVCYSALNNNKHINKNDFTYNYIGDFVENIKNKNLKINNIIYDNYSNDIVMATDGGLYIFNSEMTLTDVFNSENLLSSIGFSSLFFDSKHNLWATSTGGISKINRSASIELFAEKSNLKPPVISFCRFQNRIYTGTDNAIYVSDIINSPEEYSNTLFSKVISEKKIQNKCHSLKIINNHLLACTTDGLYQIIDNKSVKIFDCGDIFDVAVNEYHKGKIFLSCNSGLIIADYKAENGLIKIEKPVTPTQIEIPVYKTDFAENGAVWVSTFFNGLYHPNIVNNNYANPQVVFIGAEHGLENLNRISFDFYDNNLYILDFYNIKKAIMPNSPVFKAEQIVFDIDSVLSHAYKGGNADGNIFINKKNNDVYITKQGNCQLLKCLPLNNYQYQQIKLEHIITNINNFFLEDSLLWICSDEGLIKKNNNSDNRFFAAYQPFKVMINKIELNNGDSALLYSRKIVEINNNTADYTPDKVVSLPYDHFKNISFTCGVTSYENTDNNRFCYMLVGYDSKWTPADHNFKAVYSGLKPGKYIFKVKALNCTDTESNIAVYKFIISAPLYKEPAFIIPALVILIMLLVIYIKSKSDKSLSDNKLFDKLASRFGNTDSELDDLKNPGTIASKTSNSVVILNADGEIQWANKAFKKIYDFTPQQYKEHFGPNILLNELKNNKENDYLIRKAQNEKTTVNFESFHINQKGVKTYVLCALIPVCNQNHAITNWIFIETDVTKSKFAEEELSRRTDALIKSLKKLKDRGDEIEIKKEELISINSRLESGFNLINRQNIALKSSMRYAQTIQNTILPATEKINSVFDNFIIYMPKDIVSGDFYRFEQIGEKSWIVAVADCTGHGVPGAFMSLIGNNLLNDIITRNQIYDPKTIVTRLMAGISTIMNQDPTTVNDGIDITLCRIDKLFASDYNVTFCGTGSSIYICRSSSGEIIRIRGGRRQSVMNNDTKTPVSFGNHSFSLGKNDSLIMISDGIIDQNNPDRKRFGTPLLIETLKNNINNSARNTGDNIKKCLINFMNGEPQRDDITVLGIKIRD